MVSSPARRGVGYHRFHDSHQAVSQSPRHGGSVFLVGLQIKGTEDVDSSIAIVEI